MKKLDYISLENMRPYKFLSAMLAPRGAFYPGHNDAFVEYFPVMYIQLWQDPDGRVWNVPLSATEQQEIENVDPYTSYQEYIENVINENRRITTCLTCWDFITDCRRVKNDRKEVIVNIMETMTDDVITGDINTTPELRQYFKNGVWSDFRTMKNDGSMPGNWKELYLNADGTLKFVDH